MNSNNIAERFPDMKGLKTHSGCAARIAKALRVVPDVAYVIVQRGPEDFLPIAIVGKQTEHMSMCIMHYGVGVTNVA